MICITSLLCLPLGQEMLHPFDESWRLLALWPMATLFEHGQLRTSDGPIVERPGTERDDLVLPPPEHEGGQTPDALKQRTEAGIIHVRLPREASSLSAGLLPGLELLGGLSTTVQQGELGG